MSKPLGNNNSKFVIGWAVKCIALILFDILAVNGSYYITLLLRFYMHGEFRGVAENRYLPAFKEFAPYYTIACIIVFIVFKLYTSRWREAGLHDLNRIFIANATTAAIMVVGTLLFTTRMPITYYTIGAAIQFIVIAGSRFAVRLFEMERSRLRKSNVNVMIVGTGETANILRRQLETNNIAKPVCIFSYRDPGVAGNIDGIPLLSDKAKFQEYLKKYSIKIVYLADTLLERAERDEIRELSGDAEVQDFSGYLQNNSGGLTLQTLLEHTSGAISIVSESGLQEYENGELALMSLGARRDVDDVYIRDGKLFIKLYDEKGRKSLTVFYITNRPDVALIAEKYGVERVWIDLETLGKEERQKNLDTVKSRHTIEDIRTIKPMLTRAEMLVRINSWYDGSKKEIEDVIAAGADLIMLPYWKTLKEVQDFLDAVNGRCKTVLLLETKEAVDIVDEVLRLPIDEIHIGLNDLHLSYGLTFMFELLTNGTVEMLCQKFKKAGIPYGFGGIARLGTGLLPAEKVIMEHYRLGSTRAILSRTFCDYNKIEDINEVDRIFKENMRALREYEAGMATKTPEDFARNRVEVQNCVDKIVEQIRRARSNEE